MLLFRYSETVCPTEKIPALRALTGLSISEIRNRIAESQPLFGIKAFRNDWKETRHTLV